MQRFWLLILFLLFSGVTLAQVTLISPEEGERALQRMAREKSAAADAAARKSRGTILPIQFNGWTAGPLSRFGKFSAGPLAGDVAPIVAEYGYQGAERRSYQRGGETAVLEAYRFRDSSESYGLYTFLRGEDWQAREIEGEQIAFHGGSMLLRKENVLVRASTASGRPLAEADVEELRTGLEVDEGGPLPTLPRYLPRHGLLLRSRKFVLGPRALAQVAPQVPPALVDFNFGAEVQVARYALDGVPMTLAIASYPTPQIAAAKLKAWEQASSGQTQSEPSVFVRRSGPLLAILHGAREPRQAHALLGSVNYVAEITWNERFSDHDAVTLARVLLNIFLLIGLLLAFAVLAGIGFGLLRVVVQRRFPNRFFERSEEVEIIRLNLN